MKNTRIAEEVLNVMLDSMAELCGDGYLRIYDGVQPESPSVSITTQQLLAELRLNTIAFLPASKGILTARPIKHENNAKATGEATWFRVLMSDGVTALWDGAVGLSDSNMNVEQVHIEIHGRVFLDKFTFNLPMQGK